MYDMVLLETKGDSSSDRDNAYNDEDCRSEECIDLIECNDGHIFDINKPPFFDDNDDAIVEEKVVFGYDVRVLAVTLLKSKSQVSVVVSCDEASSTKIRGCRDEVDNYLVEKIVETKVQFAATKHFCSVTDDMDEELVGTLFKTLMSFVKRTVIDCHSVPMLESQFLKISPASVECSDE
ncbi:hypothetical protein Sjap_025979 [Stephania japonica]|uniref:Uncharacterized protein n=1 Tax=Stephania japonica TaxID=461633 RepID=A0AAP0EAI5_9MAGN